MRSLVQPVGAFKRPRRKLSTEYNISFVRFILPNEQVVDVPAGSYMVMGRQQGNDRHVDFDLSVVYGPESGISRTHAIMQITTTSVFIRDFEYQSFTAAVPTELLPMRDYPMSDGDEVKLGSVIMRVIFIE
ncbi:MAG: FHA domain-containing protein [Anaerolineae bacterium]|nr:FHA domain-containing protein [Anaerolineae bacterium]